MSAQTQPTPKPRQPNLFDGPADRYLSVARVCDKLSRKKSWLYKTLKTDPTFPRILRLGSRPLIVESELDAWVLLQAASAPTARKPQTAFRRKDSQ